ncbi:substrate-binding periplasmic protein [Desulfovibrio sp. Fe33]|uniref:substrate-binding periplasmic protein n=1 Tax=Desulfovibrio sp. Fe33 TaxID=3020842 RepID=UPI00234C9206|nr:transporter substrate-binding domain-containing protein [Desulfovibrio sp. Fe33]
MGKCVVRSRIGKVGIRLAGFMLAVVLLTGLSPALAAAPLRLAYPDFWPFFTMTAEGYMTGFFYEIVDEALGRMGIEVEWKEYPWSRCQVLVHSGEADAMITVPTAERQFYTVTHSDPFYVKELKIFTTVDNPKLAEIRRIDSIDDIFRLGLVVVTYNGNGWNDEYIRSRGIKIYESPQLKNVWLMLANNRGDIVIEWPIAAWPQIKAGRVTNRIVETSVSLEGMPFHLLVNRNSPYAERLPEFNDVISQMRCEGRLDEIIGKYVVAP